MRGPSAIPTPPEPINTASDNPWAPFEDRLAFDWAHYHYVLLQSSQKDILTGLDLWHATVVKHGLEQCSDTDLPWKNAQELYDTIDSVQAGAAPWKTFTFKYSGPKPPTLPQWMEDKYELNA